MNDEKNIFGGAGEAIQGGGAEWLKEEDGSYTKYMRIHYRDGRVDQHIMESGVTEKEYFQRRLDGSA